MKSSNFDCLSSIHSSPSSIYHFKCFILHPDFNLSELSLGIPGLRRAPLKIMTPSWTAARHWFLNIRYTYNMWKACIGSSDSCIIYNQRPVLNSHNKIVLVNCGKITSPFGARGTWSPSKMPMQFKNYHKLSKFSNSVQALVLISKPINTNCDCTIITDNISVGNFSN